MKCCMVAKIVEAFAFVSTCVVGKNPDTPNLSPMADEAITRGDIRGLGSSSCICGLPKTEMPTLPI